VQKPYTHLELHQDFQKLVWCHILNEEADIATFQRRLVQEKEIWVPALVGAFKFLVNDRLRVALCSYLLDDLTRVLSAPKDTEIPQEFAQVSHDFFARLVFTVIDEDRRDVLSGEFKHVGQAVLIAQESESAPESILKLTQMVTLLKGMVFTLLYHPTFFEESRRGQLVALMADAAAEAALGSWPEN
jgi:hypothetical protein